MGLCGHSVLLSVSVCPGHYSIGMNWLHTCPHIVYNHVSLFLTQMMSCVSDDI